MDILEQKIPPSGYERELLREKGQFWTPKWIAEAMVSYVLEGDRQVIFDPAVGAGAFFIAAKNIEQETNYKIELSGNEIDARALDQCIENGLSPSDLEGVELRDFVLHPPTRKFHSIVANPPYIRHHRISPSIKSELKKLSVEIIGTALDGRAGLHIYFLIRALQALEEKGHLAFIMPADTCEGIFANTLWKWITDNYKLEAVVTFSPNASPFPRVDTNPIMFLIKNDSPEKKFLWARCIKNGTPELKVWMSSDFKYLPRDDIQIHKRNILEGIKTGLSREPSHNVSKGISLSSLVKVSRGIATGENDFFFLTEERAKQLGIPNEFLIPAIGRTRDVPEDVVDNWTLTELKKKGRPTLLLSLDGRIITAFPPHVQQYLRYGETLHLNKRPLISTRNPWYKMEIRKPPAFLFAYLGRKDARFIRNLAGVVPLTGFLCIYPLNNDTNFIDKLWYVLRHPKTKANLVAVGKSYGSGAIKVEPRALDKLQIPLDVLFQAGFEKKDIDKFYSKVGLNKRIDEPIRSW